MTETVKNEVKTVVTYYPSGQKYYEENYKNGKLDGLRIMWYVTGQKFSEQNYKDGFLIL